MPLILDEGDEVLDVYPSIEVEDGYGNKTRRPSEQAVVLEKVLMQPRPSPEDGSGGQSARRNYQMYARIPDEIPGFDAYAEVFWRGRQMRLEVVGQPIRKDLPVRLAHTSALLRER